MDWSRAEHLAFCKRRALEFVDAGDLPNALTSMLSDLEKHTETRMIRSEVRNLGLKIAMHGTMGDMRAWIEAFA